ncbi:MAG TPA: hypothetical protein VGY53_04945, partial [Isosphaeraceae bacterium]|nr:hypothetical protein [Isosphaeraceae bacterium]
RANAPDLETARAALRTEHAAEARVDLERVHPSWWVRGLQDESRAVQRAVASHGPPNVRAALRRGLFLADDEIKPNQPPHPLALRWALNLWPERLVGGPAARPDDPPVIFAITGLNSVARLRLLVTVGLAKLAVALGPSETAAGLLGRDGLPMRQSDRVAHFQSLWGKSESRLVHLARIDLGTAKRAGDRIVSRLGLITVARLLTVHEPHRVRWALQHIPYSVAKQVRSRMGLANPLLSAAALIAWEERLVEMASQQLRTEGRSGSLREGQA